MVFLSYTPRRIANAEREGIQLSWSHWKCVMTLKRRNMRERGAETVEFAIVARLLITLLSDIVTNRVILPAPSTVTQEEAGAPKPAHDRERPDRDDCSDGSGQGGPAIDRTYRDGVLDIPLTAASGSATLWAVSCTNDAMTSTTIAAATTTATAPMTVAGSCITTLR